MAKPLLRLLRRKPPKPPPGPPQPSPGQLETRTIRSEHTVGYQNKTFGKKGRGPLS